MPEPGPTYKRGDAFPPWTRQLRQAVDAAPSTGIDLASATAIKAILRKTDTIGVVVTVIQPATKIADPTGAGEPGWVRVPWDAGDLAIAGVYDAEFEITWPLGMGIQTIPNADYITFTIKDDLG